MTNNTTPELPVEVQNTVHIKAEEIYNKLDELAREACHVDFGLPMFHKIIEPIETALTSYATKLFELQKVATDSDKQRKEANDGLREAKKLLNEVFQKHESGLLPDRFIYEKIKRFLYGE